MSTVTRPELREVSLTKRQWHLVVNELTDLTSFTGVAGRRVVEAPAQHRGRLCERRRRIRRSGRRRGGSGRRGDRWWDAWT